MTCETRHPAWRLALAGAVCAMTLACTSTSAPEPAPPAVQPVEEEAAEEPQVYKNTLTWTTASEVENFGFDVYRGDGEEGPFERLTASPISGAGTTDLTTEYTFEDTTIDPYRTYFYYVESISLQGVREDFTPIIEAAPKLPVQSEEETATAEPSIKGAGTS